MPFFSIIIPVHNGAAHLSLCLQSVAASTFLDWELLVVDDGSTDESAVIGCQWGARLLTTNGRLGPAAARNVGAAAANGRYLFFTDSDCQLHPDTLQQAADVLTAEPQLDALIGAYDDAPAAPNFLSQYKNLLHHYIHHTSQSQASTFWTGCGAIKRTTFQQLGGFDAQRYPRPAIEDIELGYRLSAQGGSICLAPQVQVKHMKQWRWHTLLRSDILDRAWPWAQLLLEKGEITADLNLQWSHRLSALCVYLLLFSLMAAPVIPFMLVSAVFFIVILLLLNQRLYRFFYHSRSWDFMVKAIPWHWCYYFYSSLVFFFVLVLPKRFFAG